MNLDADHLLRYTCWATAAVGVLCGLVGWPLLLDGAFGIGLANANVRDEVLPVGAALELFGLAMIVAAAGLWRRSVRWWRAVIIASAAAAVLINVVPSGADALSRAVVSLTGLAVIAWLLTPTMRGFFGTIPKAGTR